MTHDDARAIVLNAGYTIADDARNGNDTGWRLTLQSGQIVNVFDSGMYNVQGRDPAPVRALLDAVENDGAGRRVFVVYGRDEQALTQLEAMLRPWRLEPLILGRLPSEGQTVIEKLEHYQQDVVFGVVLATPDDEGHVAGKPDEKAYRVRQNVVLELGMLLGRLGRPRVAILLKNQDVMEPPSDIQGLIYVSFQDNVEEAGTVLAREINTRGIPIAMDDL